MVRFISRFVFISISTVVVNAFAQAPVVDPTPSPAAGANPVTRQQETVQQTLPPSADVFYQMQLLQQEVLNLRGLVDEQAFAIKKLKQQRLDDYLDLDRRVSELQKGNRAQNVAVLPSAPSISQPKAIRSVPASNAGETQSYRSAIDLVIVQKQYSKAITAFKTHLDTYPQGSTAGNAQYWLGQLYLQSEKLDQAQAWFEKLLSAYPNNSKVTDAKYKLGQILFNKGDKQAARTYLDDVAASTGSAAKLAKRFINNNY